MLSPGHVAAGYLVAYSFLKITKPIVDDLHLHYLLWWGIFWSFAPDLDLFFVFAKTRSLTPDDRQINHRHFYTHTPILWLLTGLAIYFFSPGVYLKNFGLLLWLGSWSHFALDSFQHGIRWLWPLNSKLYAIRDRGLTLGSDQRAGFFKHWWRFLHHYTTRARLTFYMEIAVILAASFLSYQVWQTVYAWWPMGGWRLN